MPVTKQICDIGSWLQNQNLYHSAYCIAKVLAIIIIIYLCMFASYGLWTDLTVWVCRFKAETCWSDEIKKKSLQEINK